MKKYFLFFLAFLCTACSHSTDDVFKVYDSDYDRIINNVRVKEKTPYYVTYEYKDVRIDEIAFLASKYCHDQGGKKAVLNNSILYRNYSRRATFDCVELQN